MYIRIYIYNCGKPNTKPTYHLGLGFTTKKNGEFGDGETTCELLGSLCREGKNHLQDRHKQDSGP